MIVAWRRLAWRARPTQRSGAAGVLTAAMPFAARGAHGSAAAAAFGRALLLMLGSVRMEVFVPHTSITA
jgi:hypothetical protein